MRPASQSIERRVMNDKPAVYRVGEATVTKVVEQTFSLKADKLFSAFDPAAVNGHRSWLAGQHIDAPEENLILSIHTWVIRHGGRTILVDTASGNHKDRPFSALFHQ